MAKLICLHRLKCLNRQVSHFEYVALKWSIAGFYREPTISIMNSSIGTSEYLIDVQNEKPLVCANASNAPDKSEHQKF